MVDIKGMAHLTSWEESRSRLRNNRIELNMWNKLYALRNKRNLTILCDNAEPASGETVRDVFGEAKQIGVRMSYNSKRGTRIGYRSDMSRK